MNFRPVSEDATNWPALKEAALRAQRAADWRKLNHVGRAMVLTGESSADDQRLGLGHYYLGLSHFLRGDGSGARKAFLTAQRQALAANDRPLLLLAKLGQAAIAGEIDVDFEALLALSEEALALARELGDEKSTATALGNLAEAYHLGGDTARALRYANEAAAIFLRLERWSSAGAQYATIAHVNVLRFEFARAFEALRTSWTYLSRENVALHVAWYFQVWFLVAAALRQWEATAQLYGFLTHYRDVNDAPRMQGMLPWLSEPIERQYRELGRERALELAAEGEALTVEQAQALVERLSETRYA